MRQDLSGAIDDYLTYYRSQDYSKGTQANVKSALRRFLAATGNIGVWQIEGHHISSYFERVGRTRQAQSLRVDYSVLSKFFEWARHTKRLPMDVDPLFGRRRPKNLKRERNRIHVSKFDHLLDTAEAREPRDRALVAVLLYTLLRDQEVADLRLADVDLEGGWLKARIHKSNQEDRIPISTELDRELRKWLTHYHGSVSEPLRLMDHLIPARATAPINGDGGRIVGHTSIYKPSDRIHATGRLVNPILEAVGFPVRDGNGKPCGEGAHTIRRSGARALFDALCVSGYDNALRIVQSLLHHKSVTQTEGYIGLSADRKNRDDLIRGKLLYPHASENVVALPSNSTVSA